MTEATVAGDRVGNLLVGLHSLCYRKRMHTSLRRL